MKHRDNESPAITAYVATYPDSSPFAIWSVDPAMDWFDQAATALITNKVQAVEYRLMGDPVQSYRVLSQFTLDPHIATQNAELPRIIRDCAEWIARDFNTWRETQYVSRNTVFTTGAN